LTIDVLYAIIYFNLKLQTMTVLLQKQVSISKIAFLLTGTCVALMAYYGYSALWVPSDKISLVGFALFISFFGATIFSFAGAIGLQKKEMGEQVEANEMLLMLLGVMILLVGSSLPFF